MDHQFTQIATGHFHSIGLTQNGQLFGWGAALLGNGTEIYDGNPQKITFFNRIQRSIKQISASHYCSMALTEHSGQIEVYVWGYISDDEHQVKKAMAPILLRHVLGQSIQSIANFGFGCAIGTLDRVWIFGSPVHKALIKEKATNPSLWERLGILTRPNPQLLLTSNSPFHCQLETLKHEYSCHPVQELKLPFELKQMHFTNCNSSLVYLLDAGFFLSTQGQLWVYDSMNLYPVHSPMVHELSVSVCGRALLLNQTLEWKVAHPSELLKAVLESPFVLLENPTLYTHE